MGSWKIMEIWSPRIWRIRSSGSFRRSWPSSRISPETIFPGNGTRRRMDKPVTLLPHPDSPTSPIISPFVEEEAHPVDRFGHPLAGVKKCLQIVNG